MALVLLVASLWLLGGIAGTFGAGHIVTVEEGLPVWRFSLCLVLLGAARVAVLEERRKAAVT